MEYSDPCEHLIIYFFILFCILSDVLHAYRMKCTHNGKYAKAFKQDQQYKFPIVNILRELLHMHASCYC